MKKILLLIVAAFAMTLTANAKILRVSNVSGSSAPYTSVDDAHSAASAGDIIVVEGSQTSYGDVTLRKAVKLVGPGYWLTENGVIKEGASTAKFDTITFYAEGTVITGVTAVRMYSNAANSSVITRCRVDVIDLSSTTDFIVHQNVVNVQVTGGSHRATYAQITNNIFTSTSNVMIGYLDFSTIKNNTCYRTGELYSIKSSTIENNIFYSVPTSDANGSVYTNNYTYKTNDFSDLKESSRDYEVYQDEMNLNLKGQGAFSGDDPYVISGIPTGPVITDISVPASVSQGEKLSVTLEIDLSK